MMDDHLLKLVGAGTVAATVAAYWLLKKPAPFNNNLDLTKQSIDIPGKDRAKISTLSVNGEPVEYEEEDVRTLFEAFKKGIKLSNNGPCLGWKRSPTEPFNWMTYNDVLRKARNVGTGLLAIGQPAKNSTHIGIYSQNRPEYFIIIQACYMYSMCIVPLYDTLGMEACNHIINQAQLNVVFCDKSEKVKNLLDRKKQTEPLKIIIAMETLSEEIFALGKQNDVMLFQYSDLEQNWETAPKELQPCKPNDIAIVCYTSGTTGLPKGAMLTHSNMLSSVLAISLVLRVSNIALSSNDSLLSYLPLAHAYEQMCEILLFMHGGKIGYFQGDIRMLMDDVKELQPTIFPCVPRLLNRVYDKVMAGAAENVLKSTMLSLALRFKENEIKKCIIRNNSLWDKLVFSKIQQSLGGRVRVMATGSAPLSPKIMMFLRCCMGCPVIEGYGQTESGGASNIAYPGDTELGTVGPPLRCNYVKLVDVPDMSYWASEDKGEVCIKGPNVFKGYLNDEEKTNEAIDKDGWLHTGDVGEWVANGCLKIIDRKKNIFKLSQGEYIAPEKIENVYVRSRYVAQVFIHGDSLKSSLVAIIVPDPETLPGLVKEKLNLEGDMMMLCKNEVVKKAIFKDITEVGKKGGLASFEQAKAIHLHPELFSVENAFLTPTFKLKRHVLQEYFKSQIAELYKDLQ